MLLILEKGIRGVICHAIYQYAKANSKHMKDYDKNKKSSQVLDILYGWAMSQNLSLDGFKSVEDTSQLNKDFIEDYDEVIHIRNSNYEFALKEAHRVIKFDQKAWLKPYNDIKTKLKKMKKKKQFQKRFF